MEVKSQLVYKNLAAEIDNCRQLKSNLLIITLPGTGMGRCVKEYLASNDLESYSILNFDWADPDVLSKIDQSFQQANPSQKFAVTINYPHLLNTPELKQSFFLNHIYRRYYFGVRNQVDSFNMALEINPKLTKAKCQKIYDLSDGFAQIIKYLAVNGAVEDEGLEIIKKPIETAVSKCDPDILKLLNISNPKHLKTTSKFDIQLNFDLSFSELGSLNSQKLTSFEKNVLEKMMLQEGSISKSEVSDIKWGIDKYDEFSDQAINKSMRRLNDKLSKYQIETVPKVGFILKENG